MSYEPPWAVPSFSGMAGKEIPTSLAGRAEWKVVAPGADPFTLPPTHRIHHEIVGGSRVLRVNVVDPGTDDARIGANDPAEYGIARLP